MKVELLYFDSCLNADLGELARRARSQTGARGRDRGRGHIGLCGEQRKVSEDEIPRQSDHLHRRRGRLLGRYKGKLAAYVDYSQRRAAKRLGISKTTVNEIVKRSMQEADSGSPGS